jgi:hypothetical protein
MLRLNQQTVRNSIFSTVITPRPVMTGSADGASTHRPARLLRRCHARTTHEETKKGLRCPEVPRATGDGTSPEQPAKIRVPNAAALYVGPRVASRTATERWLLLAPGPAGVGAAPLRILALLRRGTLSIVSIHAPAIGGERKPPVRLPRGATLPRLRESRSEPSGCAVVRSVVGRLRGGVSALVAPRCTKYNETAKPFEWNISRDDLIQLLQLKASDRTNRRSGSALRSRRSRRHARGFVKRLVSFSPP